MSSVKSIAPSGIDSFTLVLIQVILMSRFVLSTAFRTVSYVDGVAKINFALLAIS